MTPEEKAIELVLKYLKLSTIDKIFNSWWHIKIAKQCALIAVDEILDELSIKDLYQKSNNIYWEEVKQEIEKL